MDHPAAWIVELILAQASNQLEEHTKENKHPNQTGGKSGTFLETGSELGEKHVPGNVPELVLRESMHDDSPMNRDKDQMMKLKEKVKRNIANCRREMVHHKKMQSFKDAHGNLTQGRGVGKGGKSRGCGRGKVSKDEPSKIHSSFLTLCGKVMNKAESDNETGPIGGFLTVGGGEGKVPPAETAEEGRGAEMDEEARERPEGGTGVEIPGMVEVGTGDSESGKEKGATGTRGLIMRNMQKFIDQMNEG